MAVVATGPLSLPLEHLKTLICASTSFQTWVDAADATEAADYVHLAAADPDTTTKPYALVSFSGQDSWTESAEFGGDRNYFVPSGDLTLQFVDDVPEAYQGDDDHRDAILNFLNSVGGVISDMKDLAGYSTGATAYLAINRITKVYGPTRPERPDEKLENYIFIGFRIGWAV